MKNATEEQIGGIVAKVYFAIKGWQYCEWRHYPRPADMYY